MPSDRTAISPAGAPAPVAPYSPAIACNGFLFCSGQLGVDPATGAFAGETAAEQARQALTNLEALCVAADARLEEAVKCTVYLVDMADFAAVNEVYGEFFAAEPPARVGLAVAELPLKARVEIDAIVPLAS